MYTDTCGTDFDFAYYLSGDQVTLIQPHREAWPSLAGEDLVECLAVSPVPDSRHLSVREQRVMHLALLDSVELVS